MSNRHDLFQFAIILHLKKVQIEKLQFKMLPNNPDENSTIFPWNRVKLLKSNE